MSIPAQLNHADEGYYWDKAELIFPVGPDFKLEAICQAVSITDERYAHPGLPLLMLARFTPICVGDDVDHIIQMLVQAWTTIGKDILTDDQVRQVIERFDNRYMEFCWHYDSYKNYWWIGKGLDAETANNVHTYRRGRDQDQQKHFPNEEWNAFISEGYRVIEESRQTRTAQFNAPAYGESMLERFKPRKRYDLNITLELETTDRPLDETTVTCLLKTLEAILQAKSLGKSGTLYKEGTTIAGNHRVTKHKLWIRIMEELSLGRAIMKQMLWWLRAPLSATISDDSRPDDPLQQLDNKNTDTLQEIYAVYIAVGQGARQGSTHRKLSYLGMVNFGN
ncbi:hypothetical protein FIE12Z_12126 [Fusarium flagelliforme]|uniref:Uncharacterized protein n=1 Tax=Fusarium flagelliforme TaxID=2675880 RepID=A0A395M730_9HYPO|nr:hypothetical protein FIE12Z_12126 [Fusarium flagelliforme]